MKNLRITIALIFAVTLAVSLSSLLLPKPADAEVSEFYSPVATSVVLVDVLLAMGSALLFLLALRNFKPDLKPAYRLLAFSTLAVGLGLLIFPYIEYYGLWDNLWLNMSSYLQYLIGAPLMYLGIRMFYKKVGLSGWASSLIVALVLIALLSAAHPLLPYDGAWEGALTTTQYNLFKIVTILPFALYGVAAYMAARLRKRTGHEYAGAFTWLTVALAFYTINTLGIILIEVLGYENPYYANRLYTIPAILGDLCLLFAGYCFAAIGRPKLSSKDAAKVTSMDVILHVANMASDRTKIDSYLDDMRVVTANLKPGETPNDEDQRKLRQTYLKIEDFLVNNDPLRSFNKDDLRAEITRHFGLGHGDKTFWSSL